LLPERQVFQEQIAARTEEAGKQGRQKPQQAEHETGFFTNLCDGGCAIDLLDSNTDRYFGEPQRQMSSHERFSG